MIIEVRLNSMNQVSCLQCSSEKFYSRRTLDSYELPEGEEEEPKPDSRRSNDDDDDDDDETKGNRKRLKEDQEGVVSFRRTRGSKTD